jgi:hypothetical protein
MGAVTVDRVRTSSVHRAKLQPAEQHLVDEDMLSSQGSPASDPQGKYQEKPFRWRHLPSPAFIGRQ